MSTKTLGVLGGMGPQASASFYDLLIANTQAAKDQDHINVLIYSHAAIPDRTQAIREKTTAQLIEILKKDIQKLNGFGVDYIVLTCNTSHRFFDELSQCSDAPMLSLIDETVNYLLEKNIRKVGLLATDGTIQEKIYTKKLQEKNIAVELPDAIHQQKVMDIIYKQVKMGVAVDKKMFDEVCEQMKEREVGAIILGCTELSYYGTIENLSDFYVNPQEILAKKCIRLCGGKLLGE